MGIKRTSINDLAAKLKISKSTVSKALKGYPDVSEKTRKKVLKLAEKLNYKPNILASSLRTLKPKLLE